MPKDEVVEMCVWVYQRHGLNDAIANKMLPGPEAAMREAGGGYGMGDMTGGTGGTPKAVTIVRDSDGNNRRWELLLDDRMSRNAEFTDGSATALAIGVFKDQNDHETAFFWSEAVHLKVAPPASP